jgi:hypothetical protein
MIIRNRKNVIRNEGVALVAREWQNLYLRREIMVLRMGIKEAVRTGGMIG